MKLNITKKSPVKILEGSLAIDDRGLVSFVNDFDFPNVKRFYVVENFNTELVRAFHGHMKDAKYVYVVSGTALVVAVKLTRAKNPSKKSLLVKMILSAKKPQVLYIPPGFANGFKALEPNTKVVFFSTTTLEQAGDDDYRYPADYWGLKVWQVENR